MPGTCSQRISAPTLNTFNNRLHETYKYCTDLVWFKNPNLKKRLINHYLQYNLSNVVIVISRTTTRNNQLKGK